MGVIHADETVVQVHREEGRANTTESRMWVYASGRYSKEQIRDLAHGKVDISNNLAENAIRPFVVGRKNWLFCDTPKGAESSAIVYTMVETAKANGLDPFDYLSLLLDEIRYLGRNPSNAILESLLPWSSQIQKIVKYLE